MVTHKKVVSCDYPNDNIEKVSKWLHSKLVAEDGSIKIYRPTIIIEIIED